MNTAPGRRWPWPEIILWLGLVFYIVIISWFSLGRAHNFNAGWYDLGIMSQTVWNVGHGRGFTFTNPEIGPGGVHGTNMLRSAIHADYLLVLLAPLSWFGRTADNLLVFQTLVLAAGAWIVFRLTKMLTKSAWLGVFLGLVYLAYPPLQFANLFDFHSVTLAITFFLAAADAVVHRRDRMFWLWVALAVITKEQVGITLGLLGSGLYWWRGNRGRAGWALVVPWLWTASQIFFFIPLSRPGQTSHFIFEKYVEAESSPGTILNTLFHPRRAWELLATRVHLQAVAQLLLPLGIVWPLLAPITALLLPELLLYWWWDSPNPQTLFFHYHALFIPFLFLGLVFSWRVLRRWFEWRWPSGWRWGRAMWVAAVLVGSLLSLWKFSPWPWSPQTRWPQVAWKEELAPQVAEALAMIPSQAKAVAITQNLGAHINEHPVVQIVPNGLQQVEYVAILERKFGPNTKTDAHRRNERIMLEQLIPWLRDSRGYRQRYHAERVWLFERVGAVIEPEPVWPTNILGR